MPAPPAMVAPPQPEISYPTKATETETEKKAEKEMIDTEKKRKGRRSTILTGTGLNEIEDEYIKKKTLLGG